MDDEEKVMDVAKPGSAKPDTGSKPMVIGHKSMPADPSVKTEDSKTSEQEPDKIEAPKKKIRLEPISSMKTDEKSEPKEDESVKDLRTLEMDPDNSDDKSAETVKPEEKPDSEEGAKQEKQNEIDKEQLEREEKLQLLIKSKEYNVAIKESNSSAIKTFFITFIIVGVVGALVTLILLDAGILDIGVELPFDFIK